jgi:hypothetical protein
MHHTSARGRLGLNRVKVTIGAVAATALLGALTMPAAASTNGETAVQANSAYKILKHLDYSGPGKASLRVGYYNRAEDKGFGWNKVKRKHNITKYGAVEYIAKSPNRNHIGGQSYRMTGYAGKYRCRNGVCHLVKQYEVHLTVNQKKLRDNQDKGVITMFCRTVVKCPKWVSKTLAKQNNRSLTADADAAIAEENVPEVNDAPADETVDAGENADQNTPIEANPPAEWGDTADDSETYASSYEPLTTSTTVAALKAAPTAESEKLFASYKPLAQVRPASAVGTRYRYVGSYTKLQ